MVTPVACIADLTRTAGSGRVAITVSGSSLFHRAMGKRARRRGPEVSYPTGQHTPDDTLVSVGIPDSFKGTSKGPHQTESVVVRSPRSSETPPVGMSGR